MNCKILKAVIELNTQEINKQIKPLQEQLSSNYSELNAFNQEYYKKAIEKADYLKSIGGSLCCKRDRGNPNYSEMGKNYQQFGGSRTWCYL